MRIYYNTFSTITRYLFPKGMEALGEISLTPEPILCSGSLICYYEDLEEGIPFRGNFKNPKVYKQYLYEICEKYRDSYKGRRFYNREIGEEVLLDNKWIQVPDDFYESKKVYVLGKLIREDRYYYKDRNGGKNFYYTDEMIEYYKKKGELDSL